MSDANQHKLRRDLSVKLQARLGEVLERDLVIAHHVLDAHQARLLLIEAAVMMVRTVSASVATIGEEAWKVELLYDTTVAAIVEEVARSRSSALSRIAAELGDRKRASTA